MRLGEISRINSPSGRGRDALGIILEESPFLRFLDQCSAWELDATVFNFRPGTSIAMNTQVRALGGSYTAQDLNLPELVADSQKFHGGEVDIDVSYLADKNRNLRDFSAWFIKDLRVRIKQFAIAYESLLFNGTGLTHIIKGLKEIINGDDLPGFDGVTNLLNAQAVTGGSTKSCDLSVTTNYAKWIEWLYLALSKVKNPAGLIMNPTLFARMSTIAKRENMLGQSIDDFGNPIPNFNGIPMIQVLDTSILNNEPDDTPTTPLPSTTSLYIMSPKEQGLSLVSNSGLEWWDYDHLENKKSGKETFEIRGAWKIEDMYTIERIRNIKI